MSTSAVVMMAVILGANWGGFLALLWLALKKEAGKRTAR